MDGMPSKMWANGVEALRLRWAPFASPTVGVPVLRRRVPASASSTTTPGNALSGCWARSRRSRSTTRVVRPDMHMRVVFYATLRQVVGGRIVELHDADACTVWGLGDELIDRSTALRLQ